MAEVHLISGNLKSTRSDLVIVPHTTAGTISKGFQDMVKEAGLFDKVPEGALGDIKLFPLSGSAFKFLAFACTIDGAVSSYAAVFRIIRQIRLQLPADVLEISLPLLGCGNGKLNPAYAYLVIERAFTEFFDPKIKVSVVSLETDPNLSMKPDQRFDETFTAGQIVVTLTVEKMKEVNWLKELMQTDEFYFEKAVKKYKEFMSFDGTGLDYQELSDAFEASGTVYRAFLYTFEEKTPAFRFLKLCGELVAYIDRHAYNKKIWNKYEDFRTMALSSVNQTRWILNMIAYKSSQHDLTVMSPSIRNAFLFLKQPSENLTMLSVTHRRLVLAAFFRSGLLDQLGALLGKLFVPIGLNCVNSENTGVLYSRILYAPEIKQLWDIEPVKPFKTSRTRAPVSAEEKVKEIEAEEEAEEARKQNLIALMYSDLFAKVDLLDYDIYASILARLITSDLSRPPFNISIYAPWGKGKTSLMHFIKLHISPPKEQSEDLPVVPIKERPQSTYRTIYGWITKGLDKSSIAAVKLKNPVIWFNAWKFQKSEQIWAGLADEIIRQLAAQLGPVDQERFWLKLNMKRIDRDKIKRELFFHFVNKLFWPFIWVLAGFLCALVLPAEAITDWIYANVSASPFVAHWVAPISLVLVAAGQTFNKWRSKPPELDAGKFVLQPEYRSKTGYLHQVEDDLRQAIDIVIDEDFPAVIFIDDLDRCSPTVVAEVVEAINAFMSGELSDCYFIIGQDPQMVTASLDVNYEPVAKKIGRLETEHGSIGRFFLEKFSQLSFNIPVMDRRRREKFITSLMSVIDHEHKPAKDSEEALLKEYAGLETELDTLEEPEQIFTERYMELETQILLFAPERVSAFRQKVLNIAFRLYQVDSNELENLIIDVAVYLDSPRTIKRFLNLFLFYHFFKFTVPGRSLAMVDDDLLARWLVIMVRWPLLVQAVQWDTENCFFNGIDSLDRAGQFDAIVNKAATLEEYKKEMEAVLGAGLSWQIDPDLYTICKGNSKDRISVLLTKIVDAGIW
jgi:hypothetical protein